MTHTTKHTPGPWVVRRHEDSDTKDIRGASGEEIALCYAGDAALIAAAPAMYEALQSILAEVTNDTDGLDTAELYEIIYFIRGKAKSALAQAEGR